MKDARRTLGMTGALVLAAGGGFALHWLWGSGESSPPADEQSAQEFVAELRELRAQVARLEEKEAQQKAPRDDFAASRGQRGPHPELPSKQESLERSERRFAFLESVFTQEKRDAEWAPQAEALLLGAFANPRAPGISIAGVSCAATMCRMNASVGGNVNDVEGFADELTTRTTFLPAKTFLPKDEGAGGTSIVAYLMRPGHTLPEDPVAPAAPTRDAR